MPDLRLLAAEPSDAERAAIDAVLGPEPPASDRVARSDRTRRHLLLPVLRAAQRRVGWVSEGALAYATRRLEVPPADAYGVASFYALLALEERPADVTHVCTDLACALKGATVPDGALSEPVPRPVRARARGAADDRGRGAARAPAARAARPATAARRAAPPPAHRRGRRSRVARRLPGERRLRGARARPRARPGRRHRRDRRGEPARPRRRCLPDRDRSGRRSPGSRRARTTWSATATSPSPARSRIAS